MDESTICPIGSIDISFHPDELMIRAVKQPDALLSWMDALADTTRLRLLSLLERHELGVAELCNVVQAPQSTVSRHLKLLGDGGWTRSRRSGTANLYRMPAEDMPDPARRLWSLAREQFIATPTFKQDQLRLAEILRQRQSDAQKFFAGAAGQWDKLRTDLYGQSFITDALLALLPQDMTVADLGCGTGYLTERLAPHVGNVIGIDNSAEMLAAARQRTADLDNVDLHEGDLAALPIEDGTCDAAMLSLVLSYVEEPSAILAEAARVVKPQGGLIVVDLMPHSDDDFRRQMNQRAMGIDIHDLKQMLIENGFSSATARPLPPEPGTKGPALLLAVGRK